MGLLDQVKTKIGSGKKRVLPIALATVLGIGAVGGIAVAVKRTTSQAVVVVPVSSVNYGGSYFNTSMSGMVTSNVSQTVYLSSAETVDEVLVSEGQAVHVGDVLMTYDTTRTSIGLEKEKLNKQRIELSIQASEKNLKTLSNIKPVSDDPGGFDLPADFDDVDVPEVDLKEEYRSKQKYSTLDENSQPVNAPEKGTDAEDDANAGSNWGTEENPATFLTSDEKITLTAPFIAKWKKYAKEHEMENFYICLKRVSADGTVLAAWMQDVCTLPDAEFQVSMIDGSASFTPEELAAFIALASESGSETLEKVLTEIGEKYPDLFAQLTDEQLMGIFKGMNQETRERFINVLEALNQEDPVDPADPSNPDNPGDPRDPSEPSDPSDPTDPSNPDPATPKDPADSKPSDSSTPSDPSEPTDPATPSGGNSSSEDKPSAGESEDSKQHGGGEGGYSGSIQSLFGQRAYRTELQNILLFSATDTPGESGGISMESSLLISSDAVYTGEELARAKKEEQEKLEGLKLDLKESELKIASAQKAFDAGNVTAKINGVVKYVGDPDDFSSSSKPFIEVTSAEGLFVRSALPENLLGKVKEGDKVTVSSWETGNIYEAEVRDISPYPDNGGSFGYDQYSTQSFYPFIVYISEGQGNLNNGDWVELSYDEALNAENNSDLGEDGSYDSEDLYIAKPFVREEGGKSYVYVRGNNKKLEKRYIEIGTLSDSGYKVLSGVTEEDYIAFPYGSNVKEGAATREGSIEDLYQ